MTDLLPPVCREVTVSASPARAFNLFTLHFDAWWPRSHHLGEAGLDRAVMEPCVGGRWYEIDSDGTECDWGRVLAWEPPNRLLLAWMIDGRWRPDPDPAHASEIEVRFEAIDGGTVVRLEHRHLERMVDGVAAHDAIGGDSGWRGILTGLVGVAAAASW